MPFQQIYCICIFIIRFKIRFHTFSKSGMSHFFKIRYVTLFQNQVLTKHIIRGIINFAVEEQQIVVRVAQLDRAAGYGPEGREFESCHVHEKSICVKQMLFFACNTGRK